MLGWLGRYRIRAMLAGLPEVTQVSRVRLKPSDAVVIECSAKHLSAEQVAKISAAVQGAIPGVKVLILDAGMTMRVIEQWR